MPKNATFLTGLDIVSAYKGSHVMLSVGISKSHQCTYGMLVLIWYVQTLQRVCRDGHRTAITCQIHWRCTLLATLPLRSAC